MKKLYTLIAMMLVATFCFAQNIPVKKAFNEAPEKPVFQKMHTQQAKSGPGSEWMLYSDVVEAYWNSEGELHAYPVQYDTNGLNFPTTGDPWHPNVCGFGMTYDLSSDIFDLAADEGQISWANTETYNLDSLFIYGHYFRDQSTPAGAVDTLIIGVLTTVDNLVTLHTQTINPLITFYKVDYEPATGVQSGAIIYKILLDESMVSQQSENGGYYAAPLDLYLGINNLTDKTFHIAYTFKRGYELGLNDTIANYSRFNGWINADPRPEYYMYSSGTWAAFTDNGNYNIGGIIDSDTRYDIDATPSNWYYRMYYPCPFWGSFHYPLIMPKISCNECAIVGVEEMEKENISVYPNPATNKFTVNLAGSEKANIELFNLVGQRVYNSTATEKAEVNVSNLRAGIYMLKVSQNGKVYTSKVVVK
ncbi:MAG: T9SS type A sorting domain-containing protein [Bacteroidales bacterium]|nr:T9SS type A sorting domain-containing protein [Bacteroidales bacterium]MBR5725571.1 T9SS type A sorting domain-containing protein [Muribaculaceae bacterium]